MSDEQADAPRATGGFFSHLMASDDRAIDSLIFGGMVALVALILFSGYALYRDAASFNPLNFGTAAGALLTAIGGARRLRDWNDPPRSDH